MAMGDGPLEDVSSIKNGGYSHCYVSLPESKPPFFPTIFGTTFSKHQTASKSKVETSGPSFPNFRIRQKPQI